MRRWKPLGLAGVLEGGIGLSALLVVPLFGEMPGLVERLANSLDSTFASILTIEALSVLGLLIVPTLCMGALLPLVCAAYEASRFSGGSARSGEDAAELLSRRAAGLVSQPSITVFASKLPTPYDCATWTAPR